MNIPEDPFVRELLPEFVDTWIQDIEDQFPVMIATKNTDDVYRFGHTLKGSCFQFGLEEIAHLGIELMSLSKGQKWDESVQIVAQIRSKFIDMKEYLEKNPLTF